MFRPPRCSSAFVIFLCPNATKMFPQAFRCPLFSFKVFVHIYSDLGSAALALATCKVDVEACAICMMHSLCSVVYDVFLLCQMNLWNSWCPKVHISLFDAPSYLTNCHDMDFVVVCFASRVCMCSVEWRVARCCLVVRPVEHIRRLAAVNVGHSLVFMGMGLEAKCGPRCCLFGS